MHSPPQRLSHSTSEKYVKRKSGASTTKYRFSAQKCGYWHVQQQQRFRLKKDVVGFIIEPRGRAELGVVQDSDKSLTGLEL